MMARAGLAACFTAARLVDARLTRREVLRLLLRPARVVRVARMFCSHRTAFRSPSSFQRSLRLFPLRNTYCLTGLLPALDDVFVGALVVPGLFAQRRESPRRLRVVALDLAFASAVRMIDRVHGYAAHRGTNPAPARAACLAESLIFMVEVAHLANRRHAIH